MDERTSSESSTPLMRVVPSAIAENSTDLWEMDLSPGTFTTPCKGLSSGLMRWTFRLLVDMSVLLRTQGGQ